MFVLLLKLSFQGVVWTVHWVPHGYSHLLSMVGNVSTEKFCEVYSHAFITGKTMSYTIPNQTGKNGG